MPTISWRMKSWRQIAIEAKELTAKAVDSAKAFDYEHAADEIKTRAAPLATAAATAAKSALEQAKTPGVQEMAVGAGKVLMGTLAARRGGVGSGQVREGGKEFLAGLERVKAQHARETRKEDGKQGTGAGQE